MLRKKALIFFICCARRFAKILIGILPRTMIEICLSQFYLTALSCSPWKKAELFDFQSDQIQARMHRLALEAHS